MTTTQPEEVSLVDLRNSLGDVINRVNFTHKRMTISKHGKNVAAIIPFEELEILEELENKVDLAAFEEARAEDDGSRISLQDFLAGKRL